MEPVEPSHGCCMGLTHHKESIDMALKGFFTFIKYVLWAYCLLSTALSGLLGEGFVGEVTSEQREPCLESGRTPHR